MSLVAFSQDSEFRVLFVLLPQFNRFVHDLLGGLLIIFDLKGVK